MKSFHAWVAEMANTIEDTSTFVRETEIAINTLTNMQKRMLFADLLVPKQDTEDRIHDWVTAFCLALDGRDDGDREPMQSYLSDIVDDDIARAYIQTVGYSESKAWLVKFKNNITNGKIK